MGFLQRFFAGPPPQPQYAEIGESGEPGLYGIGVGTASAGSKPPAPIATVAAIINIISQTCGQLPRRVLRDEDHRRAPIVSPQFKHLIGKPNQLDAMGGNAFWEAVFASTEGWGNAYLWVDRLHPGWRGVLGLHFLMPQRVRPMRVGNRVRYVIEGDKAKSRGVDEIAHIAKNLYDGIEGMSPIRAGAMTHQLAQQAERTALTFFRRGTTVGGVVMHPGELKEPQADEFYDRFRRFHQGGAQAGNVLLLTGNSKYERVGIPPNEAQFLETRQFEREEILSWYAPGMPHHLLGWRSSASNWGTGVEQQSIAFVKYVLLSRLRRVEEIVCDQFLPPELSFEFDVEGLLRGDSKARSEVYAKMRQWGVLSADQWRMHEGQGPRGIPDDYLEPLNMARFNADTGELQQAPVQPASGQGPRRAEVLVGEMRCQNDACSSRVGGKKGALLAKNVGSAEVCCQFCGEVATLRGGEVIRDEHDLADALDGELTRRLSSHIDNRKAPWI